MIIKICGLKEPEHAVQAASAGADLLGFVFAKSLRQVTPEKALYITRELPREVKKVGVFVNEEPNVVNDIVKYCGLDMVQLHGEETPEYCSKISCQVIKAFRVRDFSYLGELPSYKGKAEFLLLDTYVADSPGGTGKTFDWTLAGDAAKYGNVILAGGLTPENVGKAISMSKVYGVDVSGGVETQGTKDVAKIKRFIMAARGSSNA